MQTCDTVANKPFKVGIKAAFRDYLFEGMPNGLLLILTARQEGSGMRGSLWVLALKEKITGFVSVAMDKKKDIDI